MTEPLIILPSMVEKEWKIKFDNMVTEMNRQLEELKGQIAEKDAVINDLMKKQSH